MKQIPFQLNIAMEFMRKKVEKNLSEIRGNKYIMKKILQEDRNTETSEEFNKYYLKNKSLLDENQDLIYMQNQMVDLVRKHRMLYGQKENDIWKKYHEMDQASFLEYTIENDIPYDNKHPYFNDEEFFSLLIKRYTELEQYEHCTELIKQQGKKE